MILNKIKILIFLYFLLTLVSANVNTEYKITNEQKKILSQAKSLMKSGLINEAENVYIDLFYRYPFLKEAMDPLKLILKNKKDWTALNDLALKFTEANKNSFKSQSEIIEIFIWTNNSQWQNIIKKIYNNKIISDKNIEIVLQALINNSKVDELDQLINNLRLNRSPDYFSFKYGLYHSMNMKFEESTKEYLLFLKYNPSKKLLIRNRIMAFPDIETITNKVKNILKTTDFNEAKLLLSDIEFRNKNYLGAYELLKKYSTNENEKIEFIKNLIRIKEFDIAQTVIHEIIKTSSNKLILNSAVMQLAKTYENIFVSNKYDMPITNHIIENQLLNSKFIKVNNDNSFFLTRAIEIYDSLSTHNKDNESTYYLAEIKYRILGDLDGASTLYKQIASNKKSPKFKLESINRMIDVMISKGNLENTLVLIDDLKNTEKSNEIIQILNIKKIQILFYLNKYEELKSISDLILKDNLKNNMFYNDVLKINSNILLFNNKNHELNQYSYAMLKLFQNKRTEAMQILSSINDMDNDANDKITFDLSYLYLLQGEYENALTILENIDNDSAFKEASLLLKAEIFDYILNDKTKAVEIYLFLLDNFPNSIHYEVIRLRLRDLAS